MRYKDYILGLNLAEISLGFLLTVTTFTHNEYQPSRGLEQRAGYVAEFSQGQRVCELKEKREEFSTSLARIGGYILIINGTYGLGKRKR